MEISQPLWALALSQPFSSTENASKRGDTVGWTESHIMVTTSKEALMMATPF